MARPLFYPSAKLACFLKKKKVYWSPVESVLIKFAKRLIRKFIILLLLFFSRLRRGERERVARKRMPRTFARSRSPSLTLTHSHTHTLSLALALALALSHSLTHSHTHTLSLSLALALALGQRYCCWFYGTSSTDSASKQLIWKKRWCCFALHGCPLTWRRRRWSCCCKKRRRGECFEVGGCFLPSASIDFSEAVCFEHQLGSDRRQGWWHRWSLNWLLMLQWRVCFCCTLKTLVLPVFTPEWQENATVLWLVSKLTLPLVQLFLSDNSYFQNVTSLVVGSVLFLLLWQDSKQIFWHPSICISLNLDSVSQGLNVKCH